MADVLDQVKNTLAETYVKASGRSKDDVLAAMAEEKRFTAAECVEWKFADAITPTLRAAASFDLSYCTNGLVVDPVAQLRADLKAEKAKRIAREIDGFISERRITADQRQFWIDLALENESALENIAKMPQNLPPGPVAIIVDDRQNTPANAFRAYRADLAKHRNVTR